MGAKSAMRADDGARPHDRQFRHEALLYSGPEQFVAATASFVRDSLAAEEPIMVAVIEPRRNLLREELGADAEHVHFIDMEEVGRNPARIIPAWQKWVDRNTNGAEPPQTFRGVGEPIWPGRTPAELLECHHHESLLDTAFDSGPGWWLVCPYDTASLDAGVIDRAQQTHPGTVNGTAQLSGVAYPNPDPSREGMFAEPLTEAIPAAGTGLFENAFALSDLFRLRETVARLATAAGLAVNRVEDMVLAVNELMCNSIQHGGGSGTLRLWQETGVLIGEVQDRGLIRDPLVGRIRPRGTGQGGAGVWMANHLCDLVQIRSTPAAGTTVRVQMALPAVGAVR
jgi:anti-sigma regulatory factor (Ser/Thr protein kinase)